MGTGIGSTVFSCLSGGLDTSGVVVTDPRLVAAEDIAIRWMTVRGTAEWDKTMGLGLGALVNADLSKGDLGRLEGEARNEALKVDGVIGAVVKASYSEHRLVLTGKFSLDVSGEFTLTVFADGANEVLLS